MGGRNFDFVGVVVVVVVVVMLFYLMCVESVQTN